MNPTSNKKCYPPGTTPTPALRSKNNELETPKDARRTKAIQGASVFQSLPDCARIRQPVVEILHGISSATVWRRVREGRLPKPRLDGRIASWSAGDIRLSLQGGNS